MNWEEDQRCQDCYKSLEESEFLFHSIRCSGVPIRHKELSASNIVLLREEKARVKQNADQLSLLQENMEDINKTLKKILRYKNCVQYSEYFSELEDILDDIDSFNLTALESATAGLNQSIQKLLENGSINNSSEFVFYTRKMLALTESRLKQTQLLVQTWRQNFDLSDQSENYQSVCSSDAPRIPKALKICQYKPPILPDI